MRLNLGIDDPMGVGRLDGSLSVDDMRLNPYRPLVADVKTLEGNFGGNVDITGNRDQPRLDGRLELAGLQAAGLGLPLTVKDGRVTVNLAGDRADLDGFLASEQGRLEIDGDAAWPSVDAWQVAWTCRARTNRYRPRCLASDSFAWRRTWRYGRIPIACGYVAMSVFPGHGSRSGRCRHQPVGEPDEVIVTREEAEAQEAAQAAGESTAEAMSEAGMAMDVRITLA